MAEQQTPLALGVRRHVHVSRLCGLSVRFLIKRLPGDLSFIEVSVGRLTAYTLTWVERMRWIKILKEVEHRVEGRHLLFKD